MKWGYFETALRTLKVVLCLELPAPNRYELDLSNEILIIDFGQGVAKISKFKVGSF